MVFLLCPLLYPSRFQRTKFWAEQRFNDAFYLQILISSVASGQQIQQILSLSLSRFDDHSNTFVSCPCAFLLALLRMVDHGFANEMGESLHTDCT